MSEAGLTFVGAAGTVTGSKTLLRSAGGEAVVDYGMFQGVKELREANRRLFPFPPAEIDAAALTHAHIDHSGLLPRLVAQGFTGPVYATPATAELIRILLPDAAHLQLEDAAYANRKGFSKHRPALPLFTPEDATAALRLVRTAARGAEVAIAAGIRTHFRQAGHILGSAWLDARVDTGHGDARVVFSGDLGRSGSPTMPPPDRFEGADVVVIESTYGGREHPKDTAASAIAAVVADIVARRSVLVIPAFAIDRTEEILVVLKELEDDGTIPALPVWVDSPMAATAYRAYLAHGGELAAPLRDAVAAGRNPFAPARLQFAATPEESKRLNGLAGPAIIVSASGMATGGRVLHHLKRRLPDPSTTVLFPGYQAAGTRGRSLVEGATHVKIHGELVPVKAQVRQLDMLSSHADRGDLLAWLGGAVNAPRIVCLVHGEPDSQQGLAASVERELGWRTLIPRPGERLPFSSIGLR